MKANNQSITNRVEVTFKSKDRTGFLLLKENGTAELTLENAELIEVFDVPEGLATVIGEAHCAYMELISLVPAKAKAKITKRKDQQKTITE